MALCLSVAAGATELAKRIFDNNQGLPSFGINDLLFDRDGFTWLATERGLYRISSEVVRRIDQPGSGIEGKDETFSRLVNLGAHGLLVCGDRRSYWYLPDENRFETVHWPEGSMVGKGSGIIAVDDFADVITLMLSDGTVAELDRDSLSIKPLFTYPIDLLNSHDYVDLKRTTAGDYLIAGRYRLDLWSRDGALLQQFPWGPGDGIAFGLFRDSKQRFWLYTSTGLSRVDLPSGALEKIPGIEHDVVDVAQDSDGHFWIAGSRALLSWEEVSGQIHDLSDELFDIPTIRFIKDIAIAPDGMIWIADANLGVAALRRLQQLNIREYVDDPSLPMKSSSTWAIYSRGGIVWRGSFGGLQRLDVSRDLTTSIVLQGA
ncbi:MAG: hypothetical protein ACK5HY_05130, partial [Parahaliea sp.]